MTRRRAFVCESCREVVPHPYDQFERRVEWLRAGDHTKRLAVVHETFLCRACSTVQIAAHRGEPSAQEVLI